MLVDKDRRPRWRPQRLADVSDAMVEAYFAPLSDGDLLIEN
jgi:enoyl-CoA hydratase